MPPRRRNGAGSDVAANGTAGSPVVSALTSSSGGDVFVTPQATPAGLGATPGSGVHELVQTCLRSVSQEEFEEFEALTKGLDMPELPHAMSRSPVEAKAVAEEAGKPLTCKGRLVRGFWRCHDGLEAWGYRNFPAITDLFNLAVYLVDLAIRSVRWFQFGMAAVVLGFRLVIYAIMLLPPLIRMFLAYYADRRIERRIRFGPADREYLDIYIPKEAIAAQTGKGEPVPVVIAIMGGAFIIGHRGYNAQLGSRLMDFGVMTVGIDYRNFPRACIPEMVEDVGRGVRWVFQNIRMYGGDPKNVMLLGQSAGAHLSAMLLLEHGLLEAIEKESPAPAEHVSSFNSGHDVDAWSVADLKGYLGISGPYDLANLGPHLASRGLYPRIMDHMTNHDAAGCSPNRLMETEDWKANSAGVVDLLPPIHLFHGYLDKAVPVWSSSDFAANLEAAGVRNVTLDLRKGMSHTYPVIEGPMRRHDPQVELILPMLFGEGAERRILDLPKLAPMWPVSILDAATAVCPF